MLTEIVQVDAAIANYLAGYLEGSGAFGTYFKERKRASASPGKSTFASAGIYVRVRTDNLAILKLLAAQFGGKLNQKQTSWQAWNDDAARLLHTIQPYLRTGSRKVLVNCLLEFHEFMARIRSRRKVRGRRKPLILTASEYREIQRYCQTATAFKKR